MNAGMPWLGIPLFTPSSDAIRRSSRRWLLRAERFLAMLDLHARCAPAWVRTAHER